MPLHKLGYQSWTGEKSSPWLRWIAIAIMGIRVALRSTWLNRTLIVSWIPALAFGVGFFVYEQSVARPEMREVGGRILILAGAPFEFVQVALQDPSQVRHEVWSALLMGFFRYPQAVMLVIVVAMIAPRLISFDLRNRGYLLYFSKPIAIWEYILGKGCVVGFFLISFTTLPALALYCIGLGFSSEVDAFSNTWDLPFRVLVATIVLCLPTISVALACSAMTIESRYAIFGWFAMWAVGWVSFFALSIGDFSRTMRDTRGTDEQEMAAAFGYQSKWELVSPYHVLGRVQQWVFGLLPDSAIVLPHLFVLIVVTVGSLLFIYYRIRSRLVS